MRSVTLLCCLASLFAGAEPPAAPPACHHHGDQEAMAAEKPARVGLYDLQAQLVDHAGRTVPLDLFRGHPVLISMFYGTCTNACPMLVAKVKKLESQLSPKARAGTRVLLISFDPERDTAGALGKLATSFALDDRWRLARTSPESVRDLAAALGIRYRFMADGTLNHSSVLTLLDGSGTIDQRLEGLETPHEALVERLEALNGAAKTQAPQTRPAPR